MKKINFLKIRLIFLGVGTIPLYAHPAAISAEFFIVLASIPILFVGLLSLLVYFVEIVKIDWTNLSQVKTGRPLDYNILLSLFPFSLWIIFNANIGLRHTVDMSYYLWLADIVSINIMFLIAMIEIWVLKTKGYAIFINILSFITLIIYGMQGV